jgi:alanine racemase
VKLSITLKDNAYIKEIVQLVSEYGIKHIFVKNIFEANLIKNYTFESILVIYELPTCKYDYNFAVNSIESLKQFPEYYSIELKIDTGMYRNGLIKLMKRLIS